MCVCICVYGDVCMEMCVCRCVYVCVYIDVCMCVCVRHPTHPLITYCRSPLLRRYKARYSVTLSPTSHPLSPLPPPSHLFHPPPLSPLLTPPPLTSSHPPLSQPPRSATERLLPTLRPPSPLSHPLSPL